MNLRKYGQPPFEVVVVHGGPGAPGEMAPVARELAKKFGVLEPLQSQDFVTGQIKELVASIEENAQIPVVLVGWSWGAWLSFLVVASYPALVRKLILVSSGPFEAKYAETIMPTRMKHLSPEDQKRVNAIMSDLNNPEVENKNSLFVEFGALLSRADSFDPIPYQDEVIEVQSDIYESVWKEAAMMRETGELLAEAKKIVCPVVVIHGDYDPHPFEGIQNPLSGIIKEIKFILIEKCGHHPWYEKQARTKFFDLLEVELR